MVKDVEGNNTGLSVTFEIRRVWLRNTKRNQQLHSAAFLWLRLVPPK